MGLPLLLHYVVIFLLLTVFPLFFGGPSLKTFIRHGVFTDIDEVAEVSLTLPAVYFCVKNPENKNTAWKKEKLVEEIDSNKIEISNADRDIFNYTRGWLLSSLTYSRVLLGLRKGL